MSALKVLLDKIKNDIPLKEVLWLAVGKYLVHAKIKR